MGLLFLSIILFWPSYLLAIYFVISKIVEKFSIATPRLVIVTVILNAAWLAFIGIGFARLTDYFIGHF